MAAFPARRCLGVYADVGRGLKEKTPPFSGVKFGARAKEGGSGVRVPGGGQTAETLLTGFGGISQPEIQPYTASMTETDLLDRAVVARIPVLIKAREPERSGRRIVEVESSTEEVDLDGDVVLQSALINSAANFIATGHLDIDHLSEFGARMGIPDPSSYIVGRPLDVKAMPYRRTFVEGEIRRSLDGTEDPVRNRYDELWKSLRSDPPVQWFASIYGYPLDFDDCTKAECSSTRATRLVIKAIDWRSLAFTRTPKNTALSSPARIVTAKSLLAEMIAEKAASKGMFYAPATGPVSAAGQEPIGPPLSTLLAVPPTMDDVYAASDCAKCGCGADSMPSLAGYRRHFAKCNGMDPGLADVFAHAQMYKCTMDRMLKCMAA